MKTSGLLSIMGACALCLALVGCSSGTTTSSSSSDSASTGAAPSSSAAVESGSTTSAWEFSALDEINLGNKAQTRYEKATKGDDTKKYTPVAVLATQIVSGTNYAYLCEAPDNTWHVVVIYETLKNKYSVTSDKKINISKVKTNNLNENESDEEMTGAWEINMPDAPGTITEASYFAFDNATSDTSNVQSLDLVPIVALGAQKASPGMNYRYLCGGEPVDEGSASGTHEEASAAASLYVVDVYAASTDKAEVTGLKYFDLLSYID